jgi:hypothetical protein
MGFLDNLENTLKAEEARQERDPEYWKRSQRLAEAERARAKAAQPLAEELRKGKFTADLLNEVTRISHGLRTKVYITWIGTTLRLEAREHRLELTPTAEGIVAIFLVNAEEKSSEQVDLKKSPKSLAERWLAKVGPRPEIQPLPDLD